MLLSHKHITVRLYCINLAIFYRTFPGVIFLNFLYSWEYLEYKKIIIILSDIKVKM